MMKSVIITTVAASAASALDGTDFDFVKVGDLCAGIVPDCDDQESCTAVAYAFCKGEKPTYGLLQLFAGVAVVKSPDYLDCKDVTDCDDAAILNAEKGYRDFDNKDQYAYVMGGAVFGDLSDSGAYFGIASYVAKEDLESNKISVYVATHEDGEYVSRDDSTIGAPAGPFDVCITEVTDGECSTTPKKFSTGSTKFSIFGYFAGENFDANKAETTAGGKTHLAFRTRLGVKAPEDAGDISILVNGKTPEDIGSESATKLEITVGTEKVTYSFPTTYNIGNTEGAEPEELMSVSETLEVVIHVSESKNEDNEVYIDYLFEIADMAAGKYFMYDPDITAKEDTFNGAVALAPGLFGAILSFCLF